MIHEKDSSKSDLICCDQFAASKACFIRLLKKLRKRIDLCREWQGTWQSKKQNRDVIPKGKSTDDDERKKDKGKDDKKEDGEDDDEKRKEVRGSL